MVKRLVELINQLKIRSAKQTPTATWDESSVVRPQFQRAVRIEKIVPLPSTGFSGSYFGGKPTLPDDVEWPSFDGEPMLFLGQINCIELPELIWGGVGPRNGWLLFFLQYTVSDGGHNLQCKVLHVDGAGKERSVDISNDLRENAAWLWRSMKARLATRQYQEHQCLEYAAGVHDGMGGIPRWDWVYEEFFRPYLSPQLRGNAEFDTGRTASGQPPFDKDNAVLLQLFSSEIPGWIFGDVSHIVLIIPRENLARGDFSSIKVVVQG